MSLCQLHFNMIVFHVVFSEGNRCVLTQVWLLWLKGKLFPEHLLPLPTSNNTQASTFTHLTTRLPFKHWTLRFFLFFKEVFYLFLWWQSWISISSVSDPLEIILIRIFLMTKKLKIYHIYYRCLYCHFWSMYCILVQLKYYPHTHTHTK